MAKRLIDLDDELLDAARQALGTQGISNTVRAALHHAAQTSVVEEELAWLQEGGLVDLTTKEARESVWR